MARERALTALGATVTVARAALVLHRPGHLRRVIRFVAPMAEATRRITFVVLAGRFGGLKRIRGVVCA